jgi:AcrR family transcriptional regulator
LPGIRFATYLEALAAEIRATRSGEKSRLKLFAAAARLLESVGYRDLNVEDISAEAALAKGTFYVYFDSKEQFLRELLGQYVAFEGQTFPAAVAPESAFAGVRRFVGWYVQTFESNVGLLRCMVQLSSTDEAAHSLWQTRNTAVVERAFGDLMRRLGRQPQDPALFRLALRTAGGMLDQSLFTRYGLQASPGVELRRVDYETLVELLSLLLHRAVYASDPQRDEVSRVSNLLGAAR